MKDAPTKQTEEPARKPSKGAGTGILDKLANVALCLVGLSAPCFVFGAFWWGVAALAVAGIIIVAILAVFVFSAVISVRVLKDVPHR